MNILLITRYLHETDKVVNLLNLRHQRSKK